MNKQLLKLITDESFQRFLMGTATFEEFSKWDAWVDERPENRKIYEQALELWESAKFQPSQIADLEAEWKRLQHRLRLSNSAPSRAPFTRRRSRSRFPYAGAALVFGLVFVAVLWRFHLLPGSLLVDSEASLQSVRTEYGQRATMSLPDGTTIILNANSELKYPAVWSERTARKIMLHGEAYFEVADRPPGPQDEFQVFTEDGRITVLGTKFSVYERGAGTRVALEEGEVEVAASPDTKGETQKAVLKPGELVEFDKHTQEVVPKYVDISPYITWWQKQMLLTQTPFGQIVQRLKETYGVDIRVLDKRLLKRTLSGSIENQSLFTVTDALAHALQVPVHRKGKTITFGNPAKPTK